MKTKPSRIVMLPATSPAPAPAEDGGGGPHLQLVGGFPAVGPNGPFYQQVSGDTGAGATFASLEGESLGVGPVLSCAPQPHGVTVLVALLLLVLPTRGEQLPDPTPETVSPGGQALGQAAEDPTASLMSVTLADWYTIRHHDLGEEDANAVVLRSSIPFETGSLHHILRATVPFVTDHPFLDAGLSDITVFDLVVFNQDWGRWGVGPVALLPSGGADHGTGQWALGPAVGFTARAGKLLWGAFNQNLFTYAGDDDRSAVNASVLQPILNYSLGQGWNVGCSEMTCTYDWEAGRWSSLPVGAKVAKLVKLGKLPVQLSLQYEHDFADERGDPEDTIRFALKFLFPKP